MKKKRRTLQLALCLLAGAVVTWGVAWAAALWGPEGKDSFNREASTRWLVPVPPSWPAPMREVVVTGPLETERFMITRATPDYYIATTREFGWPTRSMWVGSASHGATIYKNYLGPPSWIPASRRSSGLPVAVLPLGFALNTFFYAAVLLGVVECIAFARRRARRGSGRCPSCGYDRVGLAEGAACPECGGKA